MERHHRIEALVLSSLLALVAGAQESDPMSSPLDELLATPISTAAKYDQQLSDIPASVTVITAEEIARYGWHTLADALAAVRGAYTSYDRDYSYLGLRGVGLPSDYNNRFLVLIDGHRILNAVWGAVPVGTDLAIDLSAFSRIELVRGPGSVMYGTGAMFGVINLITKNEDEPISITAGGGSNGLQIGSGRLHLGHGTAQASVTVSWQESNGADLFYRELATSDRGGNGFVRNSDFDDYVSVLATFHWHNLRFLALDSSRTKGVPTGSWETFGGTEETTDRRSLLGMELSHTLSPGKQLDMRASVDRFHYDGVYPYGDDIWTDTARSTRWSGEAQYVWDVRPNRRVTIGGELARTTRASYSWGNADGRDRASEPFDVSSIYLQTDWQPQPRLSLTAGASYESYSTGISRFVPRIAAILRPTPRATIKLLHGEGFRVPSVYEGFWEHPELQAESIRTSEIVWEQRLTSDLLLSGSLFHLTLDDALAVIDSVTEEYGNSGNITSQGAEIQIDYRRNDGIWSYVSYSWQRGRENGQPLRNSPAHLIKSGISTPTSRSLQGAIELLYSSARRTVGGNLAGDALLANLNVTFALLPRISLGLTVRNVFDTEYSLPVGPEHVQDALAQDGRTILVRITARGR